MEIENHKEIILEALNDYRQWYGTVFDPEQEDECNKLGQIDQAIDALLGEV